MIRYPVYSDDNKLGELATSTRVVRSKRDVGTSVHVCLSTPVFKFLMTLGESWLKVGVVKYPVLLPPVSKFSWTSHP